MHNNHYYVGSQTNNPISLATFQEMQEALNGSIRIYTATLNNFVIPGYFYSKTVTVPITNYKNRFLEFWELSLVGDGESSERAVTIYFDAIDNSYCSIQLYASAKVNHVYNVFNNQYLYFTNERYATNKHIGDNILMQYNGNDITVNIVYTAYYLAN